MASSQTIAAAVEKVAMKKIQDAVEEKAQLLKAYINNEINVMMTEMFFDESSRTAYKSIIENMNNLQLDINVEKGVADTDNGCKFRVIVKNVSDTNITGSTLNMVQEAIYNARLLVTGAAK